MELSADLLSRHEYMERPNPNESHRYSRTVRTPFFLQGHCDQFATLNRTPLPRASRNQGKWQGWPPLVRTKWLLDGTMWGSLNCLRSTEYSREFRASGWGNRSTQGLMDDSPVNKSPQGCARISVVSPCALIVGDQPGAYCNPSSQAHSWAFQCTRLLLGPNLV